MYLKKKKTWKLKGLLYMFTDDFKGKGAQFLQ